MDYFFHRLHGYEVSAVATMTMYSQQAVCDTVTDQ